MNIKEEIEQHAAEADKPILRWLFSRYHWELQWGFVATCTWLHSVIRHPEFGTPLKKGGRCLPHEQS